MSSEVIFFLVWFPNVANGETVKLSNSISVPATKITQICLLSFFPISTLIYLHEWPADLTEASSVYIPPTDDRPVDFPFSLSLSLCVLPPFVRFTILALGPLWVNAQCKMCIRSTKMDLFSLKYFALLSRSKNSSSALIFLSLQCHRRKKYFLEISR